jgi:2-polyprenyl-3-methyl-5-hydroxy-6-metoxy-1,4-benzoquinol methylase
MNKVLNKIWFHYENKSIAYFRMNEIDAILKNVTITKYKNIIDLGSGDGFLTRLIFRTAFILGIDNDEAGDVSLAKKYKRINEFKLQDAKKKWSIKNKDKYDLIFSNSVLEHIKKVEYVIKNASQLNKKHYFIFTVPNNHFIKSLFPISLYHFPILSTLIKKISILRNKQLNHYNANGKNFWIRLFKKNNYTLVKIHEYLTSDQICLWNFSAIIFKFFKINIVKKDKIFNSKSFNKKCCYLFIFKKIKNV